MSETSSKEPQGWAQHLLHVGKTAYEVVDAALDMNTWDKMFEQMKGMRKQQRDDLRLLMVERGKARDARRMEMEQGIESIPPPYFFD